MGARDQDQPPEISPEEKNSDPAAGDPPPKPFHQGTANLRTAPPWKKGQSGNPSGLPKVPNRRFNQGAFEKIASKLMFMRPSQLERYLAGKETPLADKIVATFLLDAMADPKKAERVIARLLGKGTAGAPPKVPLPNLTANPKNPLDNPHLTLEELDALEAATKRKEDPGGT